MGFDGDGGAGAALGAAPIRVRCGARARRADSSARPTNAAPDAAPMSPQSDDGVATSPGRTIDSAHRATAKPSSSTRCGSPLRSPIIRVTRAPSARSGASAPANAAPRPFPTHTAAEPRAARARRREAAPTTVSAGVRARAESHCGEESTQNAAASPGMKPSGRRLSCFRSWAASHSSASRSSQLSTPPARQRSASPRSSAERACSIATSALAWPARSVVIPSSRPETPAATAAATAPSISSSAPGRGSASPTNARSRASPQPPSIDASASFAALRASIERRAPPMKRSGSHAARATDMRRPWEFEKKG